MDQKSLLSSDLVVSNDLQTKNNDLQITIEKKFPTEFLWIDFDEIYKEEDFRSGILYQSALKISCSFIPEKIEPKFLWYGVLPDANCTAHGRDVYKKYYRKNSVKYFMHPSLAYHVDEDLKALLVVLLQEKGFYWGDMEAQFGIGKKALKQLLETAKKKFPNFYKKHVREERNCVESKSTLKRKQRSEKNNLPDYSREWKRLKTSSEKYAFLNVLHNDNGYKSMNDLSAICNVSYGTICRNLESGFHNRLKIILNENHGIRGEIEIHKILTKISIPYACPFCQNILGPFSRTAFHHCHEDGLLIDLTCNTCNAQEIRRGNWKNRYIFGFEIRSDATEPYLITPPNLCSACDAARTKEMKLKIPGSIINLSS